jgi:lipopolysaccharide export system permease protein
LRTIDRYVFREIALPFAVGLGLFFVIVAFGQVLTVSDSVTGLGVGGPEILQALLYSLPPLMGLLIPASALFATLLGVGRIASDREVIALSASGYSPLSLLRVPFWMGSVLALAAAFSLIAGEPWGIRGLVNLMSHSAQRALAEGVRTGEFLQWVPGVTFLAKGKSGEELTDVIFADRRDAERPIVISARRGRILGGAEAQDLIFDLSDGLVLVEQKDRESYRVIQFERVHYRLDVGRLVTNKAKNIQSVQQKDLTSLWEAAHDPDESPGRRALCLIVFHRKLALPLATLIFSLLAVPLACRSGGGARARGFLYSAGIIGAYYYLGRAAELAARNGTYPPVLAAWTPNLVGVVVLVVLVQRLVRRAA